MLDSPLVAFFRVNSPEVTVIKKLAAKGPDGLFSSAVARPQRHRRTVGWTVSQAAWGEVWAGGGGRAAGGMAWAHFMQAGMGCLSGMGAWVDGQAWMGCGMPRRLPVQ